MSIFGNGVTAGRRKPIPLYVSTNGTWNRDGGYNPVNVSVHASAVTSGTKVVVAEGTYDVTELKEVQVIIGTYVSTLPIDGLSYTDGLPSDWNRMKEIAKAISEASGYINKYATGSIYVNKENKWAYKITPGDTINVNNHLYAVMGFNNFYLAHRSNYGGSHTTAGLTFGAVNCVGNYQMNSPTTSGTTNSGGWGECLMRTSTMPTLQSGMPDTLAQVRVPYVDYNNQSTILYSEDYLFLPAEIEVFGTRLYSPTTEANELTQFAYYANGGSKIKSLSGSAARWWLRSVSYNNSSYFCFVNKSGDVYHTYASFSYGAAPCFCV